MTRFDDFQARLGVSRIILTQRLNHLPGPGGSEAAFARTRLAGAAR